MSVLELFVKLDVKHNVVGSVNGLKVCYLKLWFWYFQVQNVEIYVILTIPNTPDDLLISIQNKKSFGCKL